MRDKEYITDSIEYSEAIRVSQALATGALYDENRRLIDDRLIHEDKSPYTVDEVNRLKDAASAGDQLAYDQLREAGIEVSK